METSSSGQVVHIAGAYPGWWQIFLGGFPYKKDRDIPGGDSYIKKTGIFLGGFLYKKDGVLVLPFRGFKKFLGVWSLY